MKTHNLIPGSAEWLAYRAQHFNASDAPAMMGCSPYKTRSQLLHELHTGLAPEVDAGTQHRFEDGHRFEALARPLAEAIIGAKLYPIVGSVDRFSASFDGLTMPEDVAWEHKTLNNELRAAMPEGIDQDDVPELPLMYRVQMEHQMLVSKETQKTLFTASKWHDGDELIEARHRWYFPDEKLRAEIVAGWAQFAKDLASYVPPEVLPPVTAVPALGLPAVTIQVNGSIALIDNLDVFGAALKAYIERINHKPQTDQDFANLDYDVKTLKKAEDALEAGESSALAQTANIDAMRKTVALYREMARSNRLIAEKLVKQEKDNRRTAIVLNAKAKFEAHVVGLNASLGKPYMPSIPADFGGSVKGLKTITSIQNAVDTELARVKIEANAAADRIRANLAALREFAADHAFLFADTPQIVLKAPEDLAALVKLRVADHQQKEVARIEAETARIRAEVEQQERARAEHNARVQAEAEVKARREADAADRAMTDAQAMAAAAAMPAPAPEVVVPTESEPKILQVAMFQQPSEPASDGPAITLGQISERLGFALQAAFLSELGFTPLPRDKKRPTATLYQESDFSRICAALVAHIGRVSTLAAA